MYKDVFIFISYFFIKKHKNIIYEKAGQNFKIHIHYFPKLSPDIKTKYRNYHKGQYGLTITLLFTYKSLT